MARSRKQEGRRGRLDPITFEVLRHRLWEINDEQGLIAARISGSPAVYEAGDFNTSILTPEGDGLFVGVYVIRQAAALDMVVKDVLARFRDDPGIFDGDVFVTNDPWSGALHMNDMAMVSPIFWRGQIVCWTGIVMHEMDVGGPVPGSWSVGARDVFGEAPLIPPLKIVERGHFRTEIDELLLRNTRTPALNGLNLRGRLASQNAMRQRIGAIIERYGVGTFREVQSEVIRYVRETVRRRLLELPDGTWSENGFIDHDGRENTLYELRLSLTKRRDKLIFDFRGTSAQAPGGINCARSGLVAGVLQIVFPMLCYDVPWSMGGLKDLIEIVSEEGTINNATYPAGVSMAPVNACQATGNLVIAALSKMYACSAKYRDEAMGVWYPGINGLVLSGTTQEGRPMTALILDPVGGGGARSNRDGIDCSGALIAPSYAIPNVERNESLYPFLQVYRKQRQDTMGHGTFRGGVGIEFLLVPHDAPAPLQGVIFSTGVSQPEARGIYGGCPGSVERDIIFRRTNVRALFAQGRIPRDSSELRWDDRELPEAKDRFELSDGDAFLNFCAGGGGYGDPLERSPDLVARDVRHGLCSADIAASVYGVASDAEGRAHAARTAELRDAIRGSRRREARPAREVFHAPGVPPASSDGGRGLMPVGPGMEVAQGVEGYVIRCVRCGYVYSPAGEDPKWGALVRDVPPRELSPLNAFAREDLISIRQFVCPGCAMAIAVNVQRRGDPFLTETALRRYGAFCFDSAVRNSELLT